jgi:hypothetical protein
MLSIFVLTVLAMAGTRIGEASNPGPTMDVGSNTVRGPALPKLWIFETVNTTGCAAFQARLDETDAHVVAGQEIRLDEADIESRKNTLLKAGWKADFSPALRTSETGWSGGTGISTRSWIGHRKRPTVPADVESPPNPRYLISVVDAVLPTGVLVVTVYLVTGIGFTGLNIAILNMLAQTLRAIGRPL